MHSRGSNGIAFSPRPPRLPPLLRRSTTLIIIIVTKLQLVSSLPGIVVTGSMGVLSDTYGRKPILLLGLLALFASTVVSLIAVWLDWCGTHPFILFNFNKRKGTWQGAPLSLVLKGGHMHRASPLKLQPIMTSRSCLEGHTGG